MKNQTKKFIEFRPNAKYVDKVEHRPNVNYNQRECISMAVNEAKQDGISWVSGWLVDNYRKDINATTIIHHCWNVDSMGNHYDTLPAQHKHYDYIQDEDVNKKYYVGQKWYISPVLFLREDKLSLMIQDGKQKEIPDEEHIRFKNENTKR